MPRIVSVRLRHPGQLYDFDAGDLELSPNDWVIVETSRGQDAGHVVLSPHQIADAQVERELKSVVRLATAADLRRMERFRQREQQALERTQEKVAEKNLPMRLIAAEYTYNGRALTIYFTAEKRVDFRELVRELAREFRTRIELRQIGARDEARLIGGIGPCGRLLCCTTFLRDFLRISVRMAKEQDLPLSPMKISGVCGRLLCCLSYECEQYRQIKALLPKIGEEVPTLRGRGKVTAISVPKEAAIVKIRAGVTVEATMEELTRAAQLEAEGKLAAAQQPYFEPALEVQEEKIKEPAPPPASGKKKKQPRRRRRRRKSTEEPKGAVAKEKARETPSTPKQRRSRSRRPEKGQARKGDTHEAATQKKDPTGTRRRRPRRRQKDSTPQRG